MSLWRGDRDQSIRRRTTTKRSLCWDNLESRRLLDGSGKFGDMTVTLKDGILTIDGSAKNDAVVVAQAPGADGKFGTDDDVVLLQNQKDKPLFLTGKLKKIVFHGKDGDDQFRNDTNVPSVAMGGNGNDQLFGGGSTDVLDGGRGDDIIDGRGTKAAGKGAQDVVTTGAGKDTVVSDKVNPNGTVPKSADTSVTDLDRAKDKVKKR